jgi:ATP-dependent Clp protease adapter protein ClpS
MAEILIRPKVKRGRTTESAKDEATILIHHNGATPNYYVTLVLQSVFALSCELAEHITWVAQARGVARIVTRSTTEAERLMNKARAAGLLDGFLLTFSLEKEHKSDKDVRKTLIPVVLSIILILSALSLAVADKTGRTAYHEGAPRPDLGIDSEKIEVPSGSFLDAIKANAALDFADVFPTAPTRSRHTPVGSQSEYKRDMMVCQ